MRRCYLCFFLTESICPQVAVLPELLPSVANDVGARAVVVGISTLEALLATSGANDWPPLVLWTNQDERLLPEVSQTAASAEWGTPRCAPCDLPK